MLNRLNRFDRCFCQAVNFSCLLGWAAILSFFMLPQAAVAAELSYRLQSPLVGGSNSALQAAENSRVNLTKQARDKVLADELRVIREAEQKIANTPEAKFLASLQSQINFVISRKIATQISDLADGTGSEPDKGVVYTDVSGNTVTYERTPTTLTVTITTLIPYSQSVIVLPR